MKQIIIYCLSLLCVSFYGCKIDEIEVFDVNNVYVQFEFEEYHASSLKFPGQDEAVFDATIFIHGLELSSAQEISITVDESSTAVEGVHYDLDDSYYFPVDTLNAVLPITIYFTEDMNTTSYFLVLNIGNLGNVNAGPLAQTTIKIDKMVFKPDWWGDSYPNYNSVGRTLLGTYSDMKYIYFIEATGISDMTDWPYADMLKATLEFKQWLIDNGPLYDEDDKLITVLI